MYPPSQCTRKAGLAGALLVAISLLTAVSSAAADNVLIDLEWRPSPQSVSVGDTVSIGLYAVASQDQNCAGMRLCLVWDSTYLNLLGVNNNGPYSWAFSGFDPQDPLNQPLTDGTGLYRAMAQLGIPAVATPAGLLVTTMQFKAVAPTPAGDTADLTIPPTLEGQTTRVWGWDPPNVVLTGTLGTASVTVLAILRGDMNCDGLVNGFDIDPFVLALTDPAGYQAAFPTCNIRNGDINSDLLVNAFDIDLFVECIVQQGCP